MSKKNRDKRISINNKIQSIINKKKNAIKNAETTQPTNIVALPIIRQDNINNHNNEEDITYIASKEYNNTLKNENNEKQEKLDKVIDGLKNKYGYNMIKRAGKMEVEDIVKCCLEEFLVF